jgi:hypothetical protein
MSSYLPEKERERKKKIFLRVQQFDIEGGVEEG